jgi:hypothetical protein
VRFRHRLALALGRTVAEIGAMPAAEFADWQAFDAVEPIGDRRLDWVGGILASVLANAHFKRGKPFAPHEFMPFVPRPPPDPMAEAHRLHHALLAYQARRAAMKTTGGADG